MIRAVGRQPIREEFLNNDLGDVRLNKRLMQLAELLDGKIESNIPQACSGNWKEIMAAYRFFSNPRVSPDLIQATHFSNVISRIADANQDPLILVQDTTSFNYQAHPATSNLGIIGKFKQYKARGIYCHSAMIYTTHGTPLGLLFQKFWSRKLKSRKEKIRFKKHIRTMSIDKKESFRWVQGLEAANFAQQIIHKRIIIVADNESDMNEVYRRALEYQIGFIIRTDYVRTCDESTPESITKYLKTSSFKDEMEIDVVHRDKIAITQFKSRQLTPKHRKALIQIWWNEITIKIRDPSTRHYIKKKVNVVFADEKMNPNVKKEILLSWIL